jgi:hypothetical protein
VGLVHNFLPNDKIFVLVTEGDYPTCCFRSLEVFDTLSELLGQFKGTPPWNEQPKSVK